MKKDTLIEIILGTVGGLLFAIGMTLGLMKEWNLLIPGIVVGLIGFIILLSIIPIYRKSHPKKTKKEVDYGIVAAWVIGIIGSLVMGTGMSLVMVGEVTTTKLVIGIITGVIGLLICVLDYPIYAYLRSNKDE